MATNLSSTQNQQFIQDSMLIEGGSQELVDVLQKIVQNAGALLEVGSCSVALLDTSGTTLITLAALHTRGRQLRHTRFQRNEGGAGWVAEHREPLVINDVSLDPRFKRLGRTPIGSMVCVPLIDADTFIGTLTASSPEIHAFSIRKLQMLTIFAEQAVLAITNARHAEIAQRQARQLEMLLDVSQGITTCLEPDALYRTIISDMRRLVPCDSAILYQYHEGAQMLSPIAELTGIAASPTCNQEVCASEVITEDVEQDKISLYSMDSVVAWAAVHRHPMVRTPAVLLQAEKEIPALSIPSSTNRAELATPLISKNTLYGVIVLQRSNAFTSEELRLVRNLSNMAAAALENVELFQRVRAEQEQLRAIVSSSSDGIALVGADGCFVEVNEAFGAIFGLEPESIVGMECVELLGCEGENAHGLCDDLCMIHKAFQLSQALPYKEVDLPIKGTPHSVGLSITPVSSIETPLCLLMARDVTAIRDANRLKANFLSMITHELRSPLNAINGYLDLALTGIAGDLNEQQQEFLQRARASSEHLYALVEDLLLITRADSGQVRLTREIHDLHEIITNAVEELELMAKDNKVNLTVEIPNNFPPIYTDAVRMQQILRNLISNALRFTPADGQVAVIASIAGNRDEHGEKICSDAEDTLLQLQVRDTGSGIPPEYQERIFERFYQAPQGTSGRISGQGLGLAIVKMIVKLHGGTVTVESEPGKGSTFTCLLPCLLS